MLYDLLPQTFVYLCPYPSPISTHWYLSFRAHIKLLLGTQTLEDTLLLMMSWFSVLSALTFRDFPGGPAVKTLCFQCRGNVFNLCSRNKDPRCHAAPGPQSQLPQGEDVDMMSETWLLTQRRQGALRSRSGLLPAVSGIWLPTGRDSRSLFHGLQCCLQNLHHFLCNSHDGITPSSVDGTLPSPT